MRRSLAIARDLYLSRSGFDTAFKNAYEDHDLCLRLGERGHEVHYCHQSVLYHLQGETTSNVTCSGSCLSTWPPLLDPSGAKPTAGAGVTGKLSTFSSPSGTQVAYNGMPLYTYSGDQSAGQANGQGIQNVWYAVTASGNSSGSGSHTGGGYGGY